MKRTLIFSLGLLLLNVTGFSQEEVALSQLHDNGTVLAEAEPINFPELQQEETLRFAPQDEPLTGAKQDQVYLLKPKVDIPITVVGAAWSLYAFTKIYSKEDMPASKVMALDPADVNGFDRGAAGNTNQKASDNSDYLFYGAMPLPIVLMADRKIRQDALKVGFLYLEAFAITGLLYTGSVYFTDRIRPETYNTSIPVSDRVNGNNQNAFFAGHPALVATSTFFCAKVYNDYHPESPWRWVFFGGAAVATGTTAYLRHVAGKHFPTDQIVGVTVGTLAGILVPHLHKNKNFNRQAWNIGPAMNYRGEGMGLSFTYHF